MNDFGIIPDFSQRSLLTLMADCGLGASAETITSREGRSFDVARRIFFVGSRRISYYATLDGETLGFWGQVDGARVSQQFVVDWNNIEPIAPLIQLVPDPPSDASDILILKFSTNVRRSLPLATFKMIALSFEQAMIKLDRSALSFEHGA